MGQSHKEIRRVIIGNDSEGRSEVQSDGPAPVVMNGIFQEGTAITDVWVFDSYPANIDGPPDGDRPFHFEPPMRGGVFRVVECAGKRPDYDPATDQSMVAEHPPRLDKGGTWERGGKNQFTTRIHKSATVDYAVVIEGQRTLILDDGKYDLIPGDVVVQLGSWHSWANSQSDSLMTFVMLGADLRERLPI